MNVTLKTPHEILTEDGDMPFLPFLLQLQPDGSWIRYMRERTGYPELFVYFNRFDGSFGVAAWTTLPCWENGLGGTFIDLEAMSAPPDWYPPDLPSLETMQMMCTPLAERVDQAYRNLVARRQKEKDLREASLQQRKAMADHYRRKGNESLAAGIEAGPYVGETEGGEELEMWKKALHDMAKRTD